MKAIKFNITDENGTSFDFSNQSSMEDFEKSNKFYTSVYEITLKWEDGVETKETFSGLNASCNLNAFLEDEEAINTIETIQEVNHHD